MRYIKLGIISYWWIEAAFLIIYGSSTDTYVIASILLIISIIMYTFGLKIVYLFSSIILTIYSAYFALVDSLYLAFTQPSHHLIVSFWCIAAMNFIVTAAGFIISVKRKL